MIFSIPYIEYIGHIASLLILISLMMKSIVKLRIFNTLGALLFFVYGAIIGAAPVLILNGALILINLYYLTIKRTKEINHVSLIAINSEELITLDIYKQNQEDISHFFGSVDIESYKDVFLVIKNDEIAGFMIGTLDNFVFDIAADYVSPRYRNFKIAETLYKTHREILRSRNITTMTATSKHPEHTQYLYKMGFKKQDKDSSEFTLDLV